MDPINVTIRSQKGDLLKGTARVETVDQKSAFWIAGKRSFRIVGTILLTTLPFAIIEPFLFMFWGSAIAFFLLLIVGPYLHLRFSDQTRTFLDVAIPCPHCHQNQSPLTPYLSSRFQTQFTVLCPRCGQTARAHSEVS